MCKTYNFTVKDGMADRAMNRARKIGRDNGMKILGSGGSGTVSGSGFSGNYLVNGNCISISIKSIPWYIPWSLVGSEINKFFKPYLTDG